jgi:IMP cyclohydrolase
LLSTYESDGTTVTTARHHLDLTTGAADAAALLDELWSALDPRFNRSKSTGCRGCAPAS